MVCRRMVVGLMCAACVMVSVGGRCWAEEPGELFPNVKTYDEDVPAPVSKPEKALEKPKAPPTPEAVVAKVKPVKPAVVVGPAAVVVKEVKISWAPYRERLLLPLMSPASQARFDKEFASQVESHVHDHGAAAAAAGEMLWRDGERKGLEGDLKMVLWLHALGLSIRDSSKLDQSAVKAQAVLPMLQAETLPVAQARVDAVTGLAFGALSKASDDLLGIALESECKLSRMQVECGFPEQAIENGKLASDIYGYLKQKSEAQKDMLAATEAWVDRARGAQILSPEWQNTLKANPNDPAVNTQLAILTLALFGDAPKAAKYAAKSDRKEIKAFAAVVEGMQGRAVDLALNPVDTLALAGASLGVAERGGGQPVDNYAIGMFVEDKLAELAAAGNLPASQADQVRTLQARAAGIVARSGIKTPVFGALAGLQNGTAAGGASKLTLFVKDNGTVVRYVKPTATENAEALKLIRAYAKDMSEKTNLKFVEVETDHCLVFTDWDASQRGFLKTNVEGAYVTVAKAFEYPLKDNVFPGKLPVFMMGTKLEFVLFARANSGRDMSNSTGMFDTTESGIGYVLMYQPDQSSRDTNLLASWGRTLTWNMGYAFAARYRSNKSFPTWLNTGLAGHVAYAQFPLNEARDAVRDWAGSGESIEEFLRASASGFSVQSVYTSVVEMLISRDKKAFVELMNKIKDGEKPETALQETYKWSLGDVNKVWRTWVQRQDNMGN